MGQRVELVVEAVVAGGQADCLVGDGARDGAVELRELEMLVGRRGWGGWGNRGCSGGGGWRNRRDRWVGWRN